MKVFCTDADGRAFVETRQVAIDQPPLWWPNGAGERKFYNLSLDIRGHRVTRRLGLRKIEVLNTPDKDENGKPGARLAFRVNGRELFMKGADWIPCSAFENEQTPARYRDLVASAAAANMNMLRLWGGGQYEKDAFYDACDELGILVWHDFMFSCAIYPGDDAFLKTVRAEAIDQVRRLHDRPSIALWCGDNECVGALNWWEAPRQNREYYRGELEKRFRVLSEVLAQEDPGRMFWPSSPCGGPGNYNDNWHDDSFGDMHNWTVWHENRSFDNYYTFRPRFCSEFGYQSFSSREVAETFCPSDSLNPTAPDFEWHQKNPGGNQRMLETMARYFRFPQGTDAMLYLSQVQQAMAIKTAVEGWRALRPRCMGTLFWQLNDNWPVASWSSVEYGGKWKHLQHHARRFYAPLAIVGLPGNHLAALNDTAKDVAAEIIVEEWAFDGTAPVKSTTFSRTLKADGVEIISNVSHAAGNFLVLRLRTADGEFTNEWLSDRYKDHDLAAAKIDVAFDGLKVTLTTDRPAFFVWANVKGIRGEFDDNSFTLLPGRPKTLTFAAKENGLTPEKLRAAFSLTHLRETY